MKSLIVSSILLLSLAPLAAQNLTQQNRMSVAGTATINVVPDQIFIGVGVETFGPTVDAATQANDAAMKNIMAALKKIGISEQKVKTETMTLAIDYKSSDHPSRGVEGYYARKTMTITSSDAATAEKAVNAALRSGANQLLGIQYNTTTLRKTRDEARVMAAKAAREKAELLAAQFGATLGKPVAISEGYSMMYGDSMWNGYYGYGRSQMYMQNAVSSRDESSGEASEVIPAGQMAVRAEVSVTFELQ